MTEEVDNPSRIMFTVNRDELYRIQLYDNELDTFVKALMRIYPGLFSYPVSIDESYVASLTMNSVAGVKMKLKNLARESIIKYIPAVRSPLIFFPIERLRPDNLYISEKEYEGRKMVFKRRLESMYQYVADPQDFLGMREGSLSGKYCRSVRLSAYFGQENENACGQCDICRGR